MKICIDAGHGGKDSGARYNDDTYEAFECDLNLDIAEELAWQLSGTKHTILMTRKTDRTLSLTTRAEYANRNNAEIFVSIHCNAAADPDVEGIEVYHFPGSHKGNTLANHVYNKMVTTFPDHKHRGVKEANFTVLRKTLMPAVLIECEFLTNPVQLQFLLNGKNQLLIAKSIKAGIDNHLSKKCKIIILNGSIKIYGSYNEAERELGIVPKVLSRIYANNILPYKIKKGKFKGCVVLKVADGVKKP